MVPPKVPEPGAPGRLPGLPLLHVLLPPVLLLPAAAACGLWVACGAAVAGLKD
jgi:hypothetical protein